MYIYKVKRPASPLLALRRQCAEALNSFSNVRRVLVGRIHRRSASVARVLISEVLARKDVFLAAWRVSEKCPFRQSAPDGGGGASPTEGAVGHRPQRGRVGVAHIGGRFFCAMGSASMWELG